MRDALLASYKDTPFGAHPDDPQAPYNLSSAQCIVRVTNRSNEVKRRVMVASMGFKGGDEAIVTDKSSPYKGRSEESLQKKVMQTGRNVNWEEDQISPTSVVLRLDGERYVVEPGQTKIVPEGLWDLYCGNYQRMNSRDPKERADEMERVAARGYAKFVLRDSNPYGFLEFTREELVAEATVLDAENLPAGQMMEI